MINRFLTVREIEIYSSAYLLFYMTTDSTPGEQLVERVSTRLDIKKEVVRNEIEKWIDVMPPHELLKYIWGKYDENKENEDKTLKSNHKARKKQVAKRDEYQCRNCGSSEDELKIDYIVPTNHDEAGNKHVTNMVTLCKPCYEKKNIDPITRDADYIYNWEEFRKKVYEKDVYTCQNCGLMGSVHDEGATELHAHHIVPLSKRGKNTLGNCVTLCNYCHEKIHYNLGEQ